MGWGKGDLTLSLPRGTRVLNGGNMFSLDITADCNERFLKWNGPEKVDAMRSGCEFQLRELKAEFLLPDEAAAIIVEMILPKRKNIQEVDPDAPQSPRQLGGLAFHPLRRTYNRRDPLNFFGLDPERPSDVVGNLGRITFDEYDYGRFERGTNHTLEGKFQFRFHAARTQFSKNHEQWLWTPCKVEFTFKDKDRTSDDQEIDFDGLIRPNDMTRKEDGVTELWFNQPAWKKCRRMGVPRKSKGKTSDDQQTQDEASPVVEAVDGINRNLDRLARASDDSDSDELSMDDPNLGRIRRYQASDDNADLAILDIPPPKPAKERTLDEIPDAEFNAMSKEEKRALILKAHPELS